MKFHVLCLNQPVFKHKCVRAWKWFYENLFSAQCGVQLVYCTAAGNECDLH